MEYECYLCKKHFSQGGKCTEIRQNCLLYENEPRGKMVHTKIKVKIDSLYGFATPVLKTGEKIILEDKTNDVEAMVNNIEKIDLNERFCVLNISYHEMEAPSFDRKKLFRIIN